MIRYIITGEVDEVVPRDATHVSVHESVKVLPARLFHKHPNIVELICHDGVMKIEQFAFYECPRLKRVIMRGMKVIEKGAFLGCTALGYIECPELLERIGYRAFSFCQCLRSIDLTSAKVVDNYSFSSCEALTDVKFGKKLESLGEMAFFHCPSLERITIPLKNGVFQRDDTFQGCTDLKRVDLVEGAILRETTAALLLEEWRDDMNAELDSINHILPFAYAGEFSDEDENFVDEAGEKAIVIRDWIRRVLRKIIYYKGEHGLLLNEAACALQLALPIDIVTNDVVPFLELPLHTFDGENEE